MWTLGQNAQRGHTELSGLCSTGQSLAVLRLYHCHNHVTVCRRVKISIWVHCCFNLIKHIVPSTNLGQGWTLQTFKMLAIFSQDFLLNHKLSLLISVHQADHWPHQYTVNNFWTQWVCYNFQSCCMLKFSNLEKKLRWICNILLGYFVLKQILTS